MLKFKVKNNVFIILIIIILVYFIDGYQIPSNQAVKIRKDVISSTLKILFYQNLVSNVIAASAKQSDSITVIGSNGKTGGLILDILKKKGIPCKAASRRQDNDGDKRYIDVTKIDTIENAIKESDVIIFTASASSDGGNAENVDYIGLKNVANECIRLQIPKLIVISVAGCTRPNSTVFGSTNFIGNIRPWKQNIMNFKREGELAVINAYKKAPSKCSYTIIRPGILFDGKAIGVSGIELNQGDTISGEINREDVAESAIAAAISKTIPRNVIFEIYQREGTKGPIESRFPMISGYEQDGNNYDVLFQGLRSF